MLSTYNGKKFHFMPFPLFCIIQKVLHKICEDKATGLIVVLYWPTQAWWPFLVRMLIAVPLLLSRYKDTLTLPSNPELIHPLNKTLKLLLRHLSGDISQARDFQLQLPMLLSNPGNLEHRNSIDHTYNDGNSTVINNRYIHFQHLS